MILTPFVRPYENETWATYSVQNSGWLQDAFDYHGSNETPPAIKPYIYGNAWETPNNTPKVEPWDEEYYFPIWQTAALTAERSFGYENFDMYEFPFFPTAYRQVKQSAQAVLSSPYASWVNGWPESFMTVPVFDHRYDYDDEDSTTLVATITSILPWHKYFESLLPEGIDGIYIVVKSECPEQSCDLQLPEFTYQIDGPVVSYLGTGSDFHESTYDKFVVSSNFTTYTGSTDCVNTLHIYPSKEFHEEYVTNKPIVYTVATVCIFFVTALVFVVYDCFVERRQNVVLSTATKSTTILSSLFPETVRGRLMDEAASVGKQEDEQEKRTVKSAASSWKMSSVAKLTDNPTDHHSQISSSHGHSSSKPIADLFPEATVL